RREDDRVLFDPIRSPNRWKSCGSIANFPPKQRGPFGLVRWIGTQRAHRRGREAVHPNHPRLVGGSGAPGESDGRLRRPIVRAPDGRERNRRGRKKQEPPEYRRLLPTTFAARGLEHYGRAAVSRFSVLCERLRTIVWVASSRSSCSMPCIEAI